MGTTKYKQVEISTVIINREARQRKTLENIDTLADSIKRLGLINPITVDKSLTLIAGERRLEACKALGLKTISVRFYEELDSNQIMLIEFEENAKREALSWQDQALAISKLHGLYKNLNQDWSMTKTGEAIGMTTPWISSNIAAAEEIAKGNKVIIESPTLKAANNILDRALTRAIDNELNNLMEIEDDKPRVEDGEERSVSPASPQMASPNKPPSKPRIDVVHSEFAGWAQSYNGRRFNLIHCDFPYGVNHQDSAQGGTASGRFTSYGDTEETYWNLCKELCLAIPKLATQSAHVMFWFSMKFYAETIAFIESKSDLALVMPQPLIWYKSDGKGIASDVNRRPRNVYETALLFSRGDRKILLPVDNVYACPTAKNRIHASEKPEPMLRHFFRMFVDESCEMLDPTCGAGSALRAADSLGAKRVLGIEMLEEFATEAQKSLSQSRALEKLSTNLGG